MTAQATKILCESTKNNYVLAKTAQINAIPAALQ